VRPYEYTPEQTEGSYFENLRRRPQRMGGTAALYLPPHQWLGRHDVKAGLDLDHIAYDQRQTRNAGELPARGRTLERQSVFAAAPAFTLHTARCGAYVQDDGSRQRGGRVDYLLKPGLRSIGRDLCGSRCLPPRLCGLYAGG